MFDAYLPKDMRDAPSLNPYVVVETPAPHNALLINPFYRKDPHASFGKHVLTPSLALTSIAGATPEHWTVRYWDENLLKGHPPYQPFPAVVGITVHLTFARRAYELAQWYRLRGAKIILGGLHVLSCPEEAAPHADSLALGEGVQLWPKILADIEHNCLQKRYAGSYLHPYRKDPPPRRDILPRNEFLTTTSMIATRGCHNRCGFCYLATKNLRIPYQMREPQQVAEEFAGNGEPYGVFTDNNLGSKPSYLRALCRELRPLEKIWSAAVTVDVTDDPTLVRDMALAGCTGVFVGLESLTAGNLDDAGKKSPRPDDYARRVAIFHRYGIQVNGSFVLGFDHDTPDVFERTAEWIEQNRLECATFHILTPYPGTPLFRQMEREGRLLHKNWDLYDTGHVVFRPRRMTEQQLEDGYRWCYKHLFTFSSIWRRKPERRSEVLPFLAMSLLYKRANLFWPILIRTGLTHAVWNPLVEITRRRHLRFRKQLVTEECRSGLAMPVAAGV
jgi:radical SAM superfamily enzyme YgiQ (UPF0313 family)